MNVKDINLTHQASRHKKAQAGRRASTGLTVKRASASYLKLAVVFPIRPLQSASDLDEAIQVLDRPTTGPESERRR